MTTEKMKNQLTIDIWNDLSFEVRNTLEILGQNFASSVPPTRYSIQGAIEGYILALRDTGVITKAESITLDSYVKTMHSA